MKINKVISDNGQTTLIEATTPNRGTIRVYIPADTLRGEYIDEFDVESGIEYGLPWEDILAQTIPPDKAAKLARLLRDDGIFTAADVAKDLNKIAAILQRLWRMDASNIRILAEQYGKGVRK